jgi:DNA-binding GntR family transcriptional regulator
VAEELRRHIVDKTPRPGGQLPSHGEVTTGWGVSVDTVKRAYGLLQDKGLIISRRGQPAHVRTRVDGGRAPAGDRSSAPDVQDAIADLERRLAEVERRLADSGC